MLSWYKNEFFPSMMKRNIGKAPILILRKRALSGAYGNILEIGMGTGANLSVYPENVQEITAVDCYVRAVPESNIRVVLKQQDVCNMSFEGDTFDTVVSTFSLCSIGNLENALGEIFRVLKPGGQMLFLEHGRSKNKAIVLIQSIFNPIYNIFAYGCNINRSYIEQMRNCGFEIAEISYEKAPIYPRLLTGFVYMGIAVKPVIEQL